MVRDMIQNGINHVITYAMVVISPANFVFGSCELPVPSPAF